MNFIKGLFSAIALIIGIFMSSYSFSKEAMVSNPNSEVKIESSKESGEHLRVAVENSFKELVSSQTLRSQNIIDSKVVTQYIPVGTKFVNAKTILINAGAEISDSHPDGQLLAILKIDAGWLKSAEAIISLYPTIKGNYDSDIQSVSFVIFYKSL
jgi:hypothetical protein